MKRVRQTFETILESLMPVEATWLDEHAEEVITVLKSIPQKKDITSEDVQAILDRDFKVGYTVVRLFLDMPKDEFEPKLRDLLRSDCGYQVTRYRKDKASYIAALNRMGLQAKMTTAINQPLRWSDVLIERLKGGRGSAIKGQQRGRRMEDFVEKILEEIFDKDQIVPRCRFTGASGLSTEKADFAIPDAADPHILIEVKAYGATGSKQTDVLGDISRIVDEKRNDTIFFLVTDGITWKERTNDLKKLIALQNQGKIQKIYTKAMVGELRSDLRSLKRTYGL